MRTLKTYITVLAVIAIVFSASIIKAENIKASTSSDLRIHIYKELVDVLKQPLWLNFQDKNIKGESEVTVCVCKTGKIVLKNVEGENTVLNTMIAHKFNSLNLWTDTNFKDNSFSFRIVSK